MTEDYKYYNNFAQQDKDSMRTAMGEKSNENEATLISQTDDLETLLNTIVSKLETLAAYTDQLEDKVDATTTAVGNAQVAIVNAIEALPHDQPV